MDFTVADIDGTIQDDILTVLEDQFRTRLGQNYNVTKRSVRPGDPNRTIGLFPVDWIPVEGSMEMAGPAAPAEYLLQRYNFRIQNLIVSSDEVLGRREYARDSKIVRAILYRDPDLAVRLRGIHETDLGTREQVKRFGVRQQRHLNNEINGSWFYLATTELWVETSSTPGAV